MIAHRFAIMPRMDFQPKGLGLGEAGLDEGRIHGPPPPRPHAPHVGRNGGWFGFWEARGDVPSPDFGVAEPMDALKNWGNLEDATEALPNQV